MIRSQGSRDKAFLVAANLSKWPTYHFTRLRSFVLSRRIHHRMQVHACDPQSFALSRSIITP